MAAVLCMVGRAHIGNAMMKSPAGLDDEVCRCVADSVPCQDGNLILSRQVACHNLSTIGKQVLTETSDAPTTNLRKKKTQMKIDSLLRTPFLPHTSRRRGNVRRSSPGHIHRTWAIAALPNYNSGRPLLLGPIAT